MTGSWTQSFCSSVRIQIHGLSGYLLLQFWSYSFNILYDVYTHNGGVHVHRILMGRRGHHLCLTDTLHFKKITPNKTTLSLSIIIKCGGILLFQFSFSLMLHAAVIWQRIHFCQCIYNSIWGCRDLMVVGFATTCAISAYHHKSCEFESYSWRGVLDTTHPTHGEVYLIRHYVVKFISDLRQVDGFLRVLWLPPLIKLTTIILLKYC